MPVSEAPYTRQYQHTHQRGHEQLVVCSRCGRQVPRYKTLIQFSGFRINDPGILQEVDRNQIHMFRQKKYVCPSCARKYKVVQPGRTVRKKHMRRF